MMAPWKPGSIGSEAIARLKSDLTPHSAGYLRNEVLARLTRDIRRVEEEIEARDSYIAQVEADRERLRDVLKQIAAPSTGGGQCTAVDLRELARQALTVAA